MNPSFQDHINALLLLCFEVTAEGNWHCFFDFAGHVDGICIHANPANHIYSRDTPIAHPFPIQRINLNRFDFIGESTEEHIQRVNTELDAAYAAVESLLKQEAAHAA
jgi:hypothetical protein